MEKQEERILIALLLLSIMIVLALIIFIMVGTNNQSKNVVNLYNTTALNQIAFSSCHLSSQLIPFGQGENYTITIIGNLNGICHWQYSLNGSASNGSIVNETKNCNYPINYMSEDVINHLLEQDKTANQCSSNLCMNQEALIETYCK